MDKTMLKDTEYKPKTSKYCNLHTWITKTYGKADHCEFCNRPSKRFEWALIKGKNHGKDITNYMQLCVSCHKRYDYNPELGKWRSNHFKQTGHSLPLWCQFKYKGVTGENNPTSKKIVKLSKDNTFIQKYNSIAEACISVNRLNGSGNIVRCMKGGRKSVYGFKWMYYSEYIKKIDNENNN